MPSVRPNRSGWSLAELLIYQALALMTLYLGSSFLYPALSLQARGLDQAERLRAAHLAMEQICSDLRLALQTSLFYEPTQGWLGGRPMGGWTSDGTLLMSDQGWFYDLKGVRRAQPNWQADFGLPLTWKEAPSLLQCQRRLAGWQWRNLLPEEANLRLKVADPKPRGPFQLDLTMGDLCLHCSVSSRQLK